MVLYSVNFRVLERRIFRLSKTFLPKTYSPTGTYAQGVYDKTTAFRLMSHAEFESYLENIIKDVVDLAIERWRVDHVISIPILCIIASFEGKDRINSFSDDITKPKPPTLLTLTNKCYAHFEHNIGNNNGIRIKNLLSLLVQVGIQENDLDAAWVGSVDAYGAHRNIVGHNSGVVAYQADPKTALEACKVILAGLKEIDQKVVSLKSIKKNKSYRG